MTTNTMIYYVAFETNSLLDSMETNIKVKEMKKIMEEGKVVEWLDSFKPVVDLSLLKPADRRYINRNLQDMEAAMHQRERRKFGVENSGLCLLLAYLIELAQRSSHGIKAWDVADEAK